MTDFARWVLLLGWWLLVSQFTLLACVVTIVFVVHMRLRWL